MRISKLVIFLAAFGLVVVNTFAQNWPSFRGPEAAGVGIDQTLPTKWNAESADNLRWKTRIPGLGHASPIVWGNRIFIATAVSSDSGAFQTQTRSNAPVPGNAKHSWRLYCLDKNSGQILWEKTAHEGAPRVKRHLKASQANSTPATDGEYVAALFGSEGLFVFDVEGKLLWKQDIGILDPGLHNDAAVQWGYASSPIIYKNFVIVQGDAHAQSFLAAFDLKTGKRIWSIARNEMPSWSTPTIYRGKQRDELITNAPKHIRGYDPLTGNELWRFANNELIVQVPTPFIAHNMFYVTGGWPGGRPIKALRPNASGDISLTEGQSANAHVAWKSERGGPYVPTPIVYGDYLYSCTDKGVLTCFNAKTGEEIYQQRVNEQGFGMSASPVAGNDKIYFAGEEGDVYVIKAGPQYELLAINSMNEAMMATPAISDNMLIIRGQHHVFGIAASKKL